MGIQTCNVQSYDSGGGILTHALGHSRPETAEPREGVPAVIVLERHAQPEKAIRDALAARPSKRGPKPKATTGWILGGLDSWADQAAAGRTPAETEAQARAWAADALAWWKATFPHSVVLAAGLHLDESTPHMHVVAVMRDSRRRVGMKAAQPEGAGRPGYTGGGKIIRYPLREKAKMMTAIHDSYQEGVGRTYGMERGEHRGRGRRGEFRRPSEQIARAQRQLEESGRAIKTERDSVERQALQVERDREAGTAERKKQERLSKAAAAGRARAAVDREEARLALRDARFKADRILGEVRSIVRDTARAFGQALRTALWEQAALIVSDACERLWRKCGLPPREAPRVPGASSRDSRRDRGFRRR